MEEFIENFNEFRDWLNDLPAKTVGRAAIIQTKVTYEIGDQTRLLFSGEWTQKAYLLSHKSLLLNAVIAALKEVNDAEAVESNLDVDSMLNYLFKGK